MASSLDGGFTLQANEHCSLRILLKLFYRIYQEVMRETMENVPLLKEIVEHYCGPDSVTAKQQHEELERVAKTLPASAPSSVKRFTDRAVLSLQVGIPPLKSAFSRVKTFCKSCLTV